MSERPAPPTFRPRWYRRRMSTWWWLGRRSYLAFTMRELSSVFVAWSVAFFLILVAALGRGEDAYRQFLSWAGRPGILLLNLVSLVFVVYHAVTWFNLAAQALVVHLGAKRVPGTVIAASNYAAWAVLSALIVWVVVGG